MRRLHYTQEIVLTYFCKFYDSLLAAFRTRHQFFLYRKCSYDLPTNAHCLSVSSLYRLLLCLVFPFENFYLSLSNLKRERERGRLREVSRSPRSILDSTDCIEMVFLFGSRHWNSNLSRHIPLYLNMLWAVWFKVPVPIKYSLIQLFFIRLSSFSSCSTTGYFAKKDKGVLVSPSEIRLNYSI